ncbi:DUF317 domain-containing protein [Streptomyces alboniger]|uniref:DUF317 domain-containing protein n=1 Tax=Streptomyces alboniger TaxID=132473 RepID=A0A5J6HHK5_STRAD|nr:DUF317 domain-containing protein [Streptomyces alboniger]QEV16555.1 DUF317 domain-containing protein [Streptomyces alboniger]
MEQPPPSPAITEATEPLADAEWKHTIDGRYLTWEAHGPQEGGVQFDAFASQRPNSPLPTWTIWGGHTAHQPAWALQLSANTPADLVQYITFEMAEGSARRLIHPAADGLALRTTLVPAPVAKATPDTRLPGHGR